MLRGSKLAILQFHTRISLLSNDMFLRRAENLTTLQFANAGLREFLPSRRARGQEMNADSAK